MPSARRSAIANPPFAARLAAYSVTAGAAVTAASTAQAGITNIVSGTDGNLLFNNLPVTGSNLPTLNLNSHTRSATFKFANLTNKFQGLRNTYSNYGFANLKGPFASMGTGNKVLNLPANHAIGNSLAFATPAESGLLVDGAMGGYVGLFGPNHNSSYVAFKFHQGAQDYYGWLKLKLDFNSDVKPSSVSLIPVQGSIYGAYAPVGEGLKTGEFSTVPEPSAVALTGLGLLALGAPGVRELRRRRQTV